MRYKERNFDMSELIAEIRNAAQIIAEPTWTDKTAIIISAIALVVSCFVGVAATVVAIRQARISKKQAEISKQQNRISLFGLRYEMHDYIVSCYQFAIQIVNFANRNEDLYGLYCTSVKNEILVKENEGLYDIYCSKSKHELFEAKQKIDNILCANEMKTYIAQLNKAQFLFSSYEIGNSVNKLSDALLLITKKCVLLNEDYLKESIASLKLIIKEFEDKHIFGQIAGELCIKTTEWS